MSTPKWTPKLTRRLLAVSAIAVAVGGFLAAAYTFHLFGGQQNCWARPVGPLGSAVFTVVMANEGFNVGFNGSKYHASPSSPWPVLNVTLGQQVIIHIINNDSIEAHGFQVVHYFDQGINGTFGLSPGKCYDLSFTANVTGSFQIRCDIFCTIHTYMLNGVLNVNP